MLGEYKFNEFYIPPILANGLELRHVYWRHIQRGERIQRDKRSELWKHIFDDRDIVWIPTKEVKEGMIMSYFAIQQFFGSRVKGLPDTTDETTKSRISADEADAIKRWEKSKYGQPQIMVVRYIPFAVFILIGMIVRHLPIWTKQPK